MADDPARQARMKHKRGELGGEDQADVTEVVGGSDMAAYASDVQLDYMGQPLKAKPERPEHMVPSGAFTFSIPKHSGVSGSTPNAGPWAIRLADALENKRPASGRDDHTVDATAGKGSYKATMEPEQQGSDLEQPSKTFSERSEYVVPKAAFTFMFPIRSKGRATEFTSDTKPTVTPATDAQRIAGAPKDGAFDRNSLETGQSGQVSRTTTDARVGTRAENFLALLILNAALRDIESCQNYVNSQLYDFKDLSREAACLRFLSKEFWDVLDQCYEADAAIKNFEIEYHELKLKDDKWHEGAGRYPKNVTDKLLKGATLSTADKDSVVAWERRLWDNAMGEDSYRRGRLMQLIDRTRSERSKHETRLNDIAYDLLAQHSLLLC